jgi:hypothetical protein
VVAVALLGALTVKTVVLVVVRVAQIVRLVLAQLIKVLLVEHKTATTILIQAVVVVQVQ